MVWFRDENSQTVFYSTCLVCMVIFAKRVNDLVFYQDEGFLFNVLNNVQTFFALMAITITHTLVDQVFIDHVKQRMRFFVHRVIIFERFVDRSKVR